MGPILERGYIPTHVTGDTLVQTGQGELHSIVLNGLTTAGDASVYDGVDATGTLLAVLHLDPTTSVSVQPINLLYEAAVDTGIYIDFDQSLVADLTVMHQ